VKKDAVIGIRLDQAITTETARVDDPITARVSRDVVVDGVTAIVVGTRLEGLVTLVDRGSRGGGRGKLGIRFTTLVRADNTRVAIHTDTIFREGEPAGESPAALDARAAFSAIVSNGSRPVFRNTATSAAAPGAPLHSDARLRAGSLLTVQLTAPLSMSSERDQNPM
jgi:hypothetical protein